MRFKGIRAKFIFTFLALVFVPLSIAGVYGIYHSVSALEDTTLHHLEYEISSKADDIEMFLKGVHLDVLFLSRSFALKELVDSKETNSSEEFERLRKRFAQEGRAFVQSRPQYYQVRYIDESGYETVRVDSHGGTTEVVPRKKLQYKGDRYYFIESMKYPGGQCYVSPMDLNIEWGIVEVPQRVVVRVATPVFDSRGRKKGVVIINLFADYLMQHFKAMNMAKGGRSFLLNKNGYYLSHFNSQGEELFNIGSTKSFKEDYPQDVVAGILSGTKGTFKTDKSIIAYAPIHTGDAMSGDYWVFSLVYSKKAIFASIFRLEVMLMVLGSFAAITSLLVGLWMARQFTGPILKLHEGVEWIAEGDFDHKLDIKSGDEIESLAHRFNAMGDVLKASRERMERWNEELKKEVDNRTKDLKIERNKLSSIIMSASEGIIVADREDRIIILNPAAMHILGVRPEEMIGRNIFESYSDLKALKDIIDGNAAVAAKSITRLINSKTVDVSGAVINYEGEKFGSRIVLRDVTEKQKMIEERMVLERQLYHADKLVSLGELSAGIAHEIGNPLAAIKTVIQAMNDESPFNLEQKKYMKRILKEVDRLALFIRRFSEYAHTGAVESAKCRVNQVLGDVLFLIRNEARKHDIRLRHAIVKDIPDAAIDPDQLKQVLVNLLLNAIQAMQDGGGGELTVGVSELDGKSVVISVSDTGPGIEKENIERIFDPFFTTKASGTGLGLSIVHKIIKEYEGDIRVMSEVGKGAVFEVVLPAVDDSVEGVSL